MLTVGVDLAAQAPKTAVASIDWSTPTPTVVSLTVGVTDDQLIDAIAAGDQVGIDAPLGWPEGFITFLEAQRDGSLATFAYADEWRRLAFRETDLFVRDRLGVTPLSVSTDRLGLTAIHAAALLARLRAAGTPVDRLGHDVVVEVYPAVALKQWGLLHGSYKGRNGAGLSPLVDRIHVAAPWLDFGPHEALCRVSDDAFDAVVAALVARAHRLGATLSPPTELLEHARLEGWIAVPVGPLGDLVTLR